MNWDAIGASAELLGAIGVIASLIYLATQIRQSREQMGQNTRALQAGSYQQYSQHVHQVMEKPFDSPEREQAVRLGMNDFAALSEEDTFRFNFWMIGVVHAFDNGHYQYRVGMLDDERWQRHYTSVRLLFQSPGVGQWWRATTTPNVSPEFFALVEEILGEEPDRAEP